MAQKSSDYMAFLNALYARCGEIAAEFSYSDENRDSMMTFDGPLEGNFPWIYCRFSSTIRSLDDIDRIKWKFVKFCQEHDECSFEKIEVYSSQGLKIKVSLIHKV